MGKGEGGEALSVVEGGRWKVEGGRCRRPSPNSGFAWSIKTPI